MEVIENIYKKIADDRAAIGDRLYWGRFVAEQLLTLVTKGVTLPSPDTLHKYSTLKNAQELLLTYVNKDIDEYIHIGGIYITKENLELYEQYPPVPATLSLERLNPAPASDNELSNRVHTPPTRQK